LFLNTKHVSAKSSKFSQKLGENQNFAQKMEIEVENRDFDHKCLGHK